MNKKKIKLLSICILVSGITIFTNNNEIFLTDSKNLISILLTILSLCFTSFSFISSTILKLFNSDKKNKKEIRELVDILLKSIEEDIFLILYSTIVLIICNLICFFDIPLITNPTNIDFGIFEILSLKNSIFNFISSFIVCLSLYSMYDIMKASFKIIRSSNIN